jgi:class 3 adenylate cyclase
MKRKIAAIFAADVVGYSKLVAEDEEETLRRLQSYRAVMDDFIARAGGRIFNTAGDAVLAEFSSSVEAVRCAIDIQESLRTRNMAYPTSRQMSFRIGITVGDVVERDGDLLGDGVNIAARLEGIAPVGGICISRTVHEQVANKLSVHFADIGEQHVKNIPTPVHAYKMNTDDAGCRDGSVPCGACDRRHRLFDIRRMEEAAGCEPSQPAACHARYVRDDAGPGRHINFSRPVGGNAGAGNYSFRPRSCPRRCPQRIRASCRSQGTCHQYWPDWIQYGSSRRRERKIDGAGYLPETGRYAAAAAQMRALCSRQYRGLRPRPSANAAGALGQARSVNCAAVGRQ